MNGVRPLLRCCQLLTNTTHALTFTMILTQVAPIVYCKTMHGLPRQCKNSATILSTPSRLCLQKWNNGASMLQTEMTAWRAMGVRQAQRQGSNVIMQNLSSKRPYTKLAQASQVTPLHAYFTEKSRDMISLTSAPSLHVVPHIVSKLTLRPSTLQRPLD